MPNSPPKPCSHCGCGVLVRDGSDRCEQHKVRAGQFADRSRGTRQQRGYGADWDRRRLRILNAAGGLCQCDECKQAKRLRSATQVDHIVNKAKWRQLHGSLAGVDADSNLQAINKDCHKAKTAREAAAGRAASRRPGGE